MNNVERIEYVKYRIESSRKTYDAAKVLYDNGFWNSAINRLYYAFFYSIKCFISPK